MHVAELIARWTVGKLVKTRGGVAQDTFEQAVEVMNDARKLIKVFTQKSGNMDLLEKSANVKQVPFVSPVSDDKNKTRVSATYLLVLRLLRAGPAIDAFFVNYENKEMVALKERIWQTLTDLEAVLHIVRLYTLKVQEENEFNTALIARQRIELHQKLKANKLDRLKLDSLLKKETNRNNKDLDRKTVELQTEVGRRAQQRAYAEAVRRIGDETLTTEDKMALLLDHRTTNAAKELLGATEYKQALADLHDANINMGLLQAGYSEGTEDLEEDIDCEESTMAHSSAFAIEDLMSLGDSNVMSGTSNKSVRLSGRERCKKRMSNEFGASIIAWGECAVRFPRHKQFYKTGDIGRDLAASDENRQGAYGCLPRLVLLFLSCPEASSFCERINSATKLVMTKKQTKYSDLILGRYPYFSKVEKSVPHQFVENRFQKADKKCPSLLFEDQESVPGGARTRNQR